MANCPLFRNRYMKSIYTFIIVCFFELSINAQVIDKQTIEGLENIKSGFIEMGFNKIKNASSVNDLNAQYFLGECFQYGIGVEINMEEAFLLYRKAAERGLTDAMLKISDFYKKGIVVAQDDKKANLWLSRYKKRGGKNILPDILALYNEGIKHLEDNSKDPNQSIVTSKSDNQILADNKNLSNEEHFKIDNTTKAQDFNKQYQSTINIDETDTYTSDVDVEIPGTTNTKDRTFVLVMANEDYHDVAIVPNAINDGIIFAEYCKKTLGIPSENIHLIKNATLNNIKREINLMGQIAEAYSGEASFIIYYAGHGIPDESTASSYILPIDGYTSDLSTCLSLSDFYTRLAKYPSNKILVFMDACFSGSLRGEGMLQAARGVVLKAKPAKPTGKMVIFSAAQGDETAYPLDKEKHGLFTYWLLKNIKDSKGNISLGDLADTVINSVCKQSLVINGKKQTPSVQTSLEVKDDWRTWMLNE